MKRLEIENLGPIRRADVTFGDLTILVGPQASGKSLFVQTYKALVDAKAIRKELRNYGFDWQKADAPIKSFCTTYYGGGSSVRAGGLLRGSSLRDTNGGQGGGKEVAMASGVFASESASQTSDVAE